MSKIVVLLGICTIFSHSFAAIFDLIEIEDRLASIWERKKANFERQYNECTVKKGSDVMQGVCSHPSTCLLTGGKLNGICGVLGTCCTHEMGCGASTRTKISYFEGSGHQLAQGGSCEFHVKAFSPNVCQLRLDFVSFSLSPPEINMETIYDATNQPITVNRYRCLKDQFSVSPNFYNIPELCGENTGQHVYVHINNTDMVSLKFAFSANSVSPQQFKIKVTQLECPGIRTGFNSHKLDNSEFDFNKLAPTGAVQYFPEYSGRFWSFSGSNANAGGYTFGQSYAIAFKRYPEVCGVRFTPNVIRLARDVAITPATDASCYDYLFVPGLSMEDPFVAKVCNTKGTKVITSTPPGPLYIYFVSNNDAIDPAAKYEFDINYNLLTSSSCQA